MQIVSIGDNLHEMSSSFFSGKNGDNLHVILFSGKNKKNLNMLSAKHFTQSAKR